MPLVVFSAAALPALGRAADVVMRTVERGDLFVVDAGDAGDFDLSVFEADLVAAFDAFEEAALLVAESPQQLVGSQVSVCAPRAAWCAALEVLEGDRSSTWAPMQALVADLERALA